MMDKVVVLFADDEEDFRFLSIRQIQRYLKNHQFAFLEASDGEEALALLKEGARPSLMIFDYVMPKMNGPQLLRSIDRDYPELRDVPRIMISGYLRHEDVKKESQQLRCIFFEKNLDADFFSQVCRHIEARLGESTIDQSKRHDGER